jgi:protease-4
MAASGGYVAALGTDRIVALGNALVGSIGVLVQYPNFAKLLDTVGVKMEDVKSSPLKASPSGYEPTSPEARAALAALVGDSFTWFKALVKERRNMTSEQLDAVTDGRVFTGRQGMELHLVDRLGGEREAIEWLEQEKNIPKGLPVRDWKQERTLERLGILSFSARAAELLGLAGLSGALDHAASAAQERMLDGLVSIWAGRSRGHELGLDERQHADWQCELGLRAALHGKAADRSKVCGSAGDSARELGQAVGNG